MNLIFRYRQRKTMQLVAVLCMASIILPWVPLRDAYASSWNPKLLVNTEAFQTIDDSDTTANIVLKFGDTVNKQILWDRTASNFRFSDSVEIIGTASGRVLHAQDRLESSGSLLVTGNGKFDGGTLWIDSANNKVGVNNLNPKTAFEVIGTASGTDVHASRQLRSSGSLLVNGAVTLKSFQNCSALETANGILGCGTDDTGTGGGGTFGSGNVLTLGDARYVNQSGDFMTGSLLIKNNGFLNASGSLISNGNLTINSDNGATDAVLTFGNSLAAQTITFNAASQRFDFTKEIHTSSNVTASGNIIVTGNLKVDGATLFADGTSNKVGINTLVPETQLEVIGTASGKIIHAQDRLASSGVLVLRTPGASLPTLYADGSGKGKSDRRGTRSENDLVSIEDVPRRSRYPLQRCEGTARC